MSTDRRDGVPASGSRADPYAPAVLDEMETDLDAVELESEIDEEGNLRIYSAENFLNSTLGDTSSPGSMDSVSAAELFSWEKRQADKRQYSHEGAPEEVESENQRNGAFAPPRRRSFSMDTSGFGGVRGVYGKLRKPVLCGLAVGPNGSGDPPSHPQGASLQGHDLHDIELSVFNPTRTAESNIDGESQPAREDHSSVSNVDTLERGEGRRRRSSIPEDAKWWQRPLYIARNFFTDMSCQRLAIVVALAAVAVGVLLTVSLVPASFVYIEYSELALAKNRVTGAVNRADVYYPGCYLLTPQTELLRFKGTAHTLKQTMELQTSDQLTFSLGLSLQYFIKPEELGALFTNYEDKYESVIETVFRSTIKNQAGQFSLDEFRLNRTQVARDFERAMSLRLSGNCCPSCCPLDCQGKVDCRACIAVGAGCHRGFHMELRYFQMGVLDIPDEISERLIQQTILLIQAEKEMFVQQHAVETKISERDQQEILNRAREIREAAQAESDRIHAVSEAEYEKVVQTAHITALGKMYLRLNVSREDHKLSLMYVRALEDTADNLYNMNFEKMTLFN